MFYFWILIAFISGLIIGDFTPQFIPTAYKKLVAKYKEIKK